MADKCAVCNAPIEIIFLEKINGTWLRSKAKKRAVCSACQKKYSLKDIREKL